MLLKVRLRKRIYPHTFERNVGLLGYALAQDLGRCAYSLHKSGRSSRLSALSRCSFSTLGYNLVSAESLRLRSMCICQYQQKQDKMTRSVRETNVSFYLLFFSGSKSSRRDLSRYLGVDNKSNFQVNQRQAVRHTIQKRELKIATRWLQLTRCQNQFPQMKDAFSKSMISRICCVIRIINAVLIGNVAMIDVFACQGSSGGTVFNSNGKVVGLLSASARVKGQAPVGTFASETNGAWSRNCFRSDGESHSRNGE